MLPIHARCFASVYRSRIHLRCDFRATEVSETTRRKFRLSSCIAHYCESCRSKKNLINEHRPDVSVEARTDAHRGLQCFSRDFNACFSCTFSAIITFNAKFNTKEINCPAELCRNKQLANGFVVKQLCRGSTSSRIIAQVHIIRGWKRIDPSAGTNSAIIMRTMTQIRREAAWSSVCSSRTENLNLKQMTVLDTHTGVPHNSYSVNTGVIVT